jgi:hypothetical protein
MPDQMKDALRSLGYCHKQAHGSEGAAEAHIRALVKLGKETAPDLLSPYRCTKCGKWHVGRPRRPVEEETS